MARLPVLLIAGFLFFLTFSKNCIKINRFINFLNKKNDLKKVQQCEVLILEVEAEEKIFVSRSYITYIGS